MLIDKELEFSDAQAITAAAASTNIVDQGTAGDAFEHGLRFVVTIVDETDLDPTTSLTVALQTATDAAFSSPVTLYTQTTLTAALLAGTKLVDVLVPGGALQFLRAYYTPNGGNATQGAVDAALVRNTMNNDFSA